MGYYKTPWLSIVIILVLSKTKHIEIRYHFIRDLVERKIMTLEYIPTECQNVDIFTKPLDRNKFETLHQVIGVILCP